MSLEDFITWVYCWVDDILSLVVPGRRLRQRDFGSEFTDAEAITTELADEFRHGSKIGHLSEHGAGEIQPSSARSSSTDNVHSISNLAEDRYFCQQIAA